MKTVLITGCTSGFGKLLVKNFLANNDRVIATGRGLTTRGIFSEERTKYGENLIEMDLDITDSKQRSSVLKSISSLDILINNAGYGLTGALEDLSEDQIRAQMEVNFFGTTLMTQETLPLLRKSKGMIINISSAFGFVGFPLNSLYCASKFAVEGFSEALSHELAPHGVKVCIVEPGAYRTNFGTKMLWGNKSQDAQSPYFKQTSNFQRFQQKLMARPNPPNPQEVADKILNLSTQKSPPLRVRCGKDSQATHFLKRLTPSQTFYNLSGRMYQKMFSKELN